jgi:hypothetical protein
MIGKKIFCLFLFGIILNQIVSANLPNEEFFPESKTSLGEFFDGGGSLYDIGSYSKIEEMMAGGEGGGDVKSVNNGTSDQENNRDKKKTSDDSSKDKKDCVDSGGGGSGGFGGGPPERPIKNGFEKIVEMNRMIKNIHSQSQLNEFLKELDNEAKRPEGRITYALNIITDDFFGVVDNESVDEIRNRHRLLDLAIEHMSISCILYNAKETEILFLKNSGFSFI